MAAFLLDEALGQRMAADDLRAMDRAKSSKGLPRGMTVVDASVYGPDPAPPVKPDA